MVLILVTFIHFCSKCLILGLVIFNEDLPPRKVGKWRFSLREWKTWLCIIIYAWESLAVLMWKRLCVILASEHLSSIWVCLLPLTLPSYTVNACLSPILSLLWRHQKNVTVLITWFFFEPKRNGSTDESYNAGISKEDLIELEIINGVHDVEKCRSSWMTCVGGADNVILPNKR
jgi:hypothetical protein